MGAARYKPYPAYKPSGVEWLGDIPEGWEAKRLGNLFEERREKVSDKDYPPLSVTMQGIVPQLETAAKSLDSDNRKLVKAGDFVINSRSDRKGSAGLSALDGSVTLISNVLKPRDIEGSFAHHLLKSYPFQEEYYRFGKGIVADLWSTNFNSMKNITLPVVPKEEQTKIAAFLDYETGKIDALIAKQERLIALLEEKRQAVISHAVTKGLNPNAPLRPSGIDWLGDVPEHWEVGRLRWYISISSGEGLSNQFITSNLDENNANRVVGGNGAMGFTNKVNTTEKRIVIGRVGALCGNVHFFDEDCWITDNALQISKWRSFSDDFLVHLIRAANLNDLANKSAQPLITGNQVKSIEVAIPPVEEQKKIEKFLENQVDIFAKLSSKAQSAITLLKERRTALISAAVTGKIDVRDWQPPQAVSDTDLSTETLQEAAL
ncbi:restriction endonuclease subunit S [Roseibium algae]|uniref:Restriction endonuclease subunit S n=1 Tax=Roseibium algae TaxID=3123038 RepID=A0ABU8TR58_9HYPH